MICDHDSPGHRLQLVRRKLCLQTILFLAFFGIATIGTGCSPFQPSEVYYKRDALYNFQEEGFAAANILQAAGRSELRSTDAAGASSSNPLNTMRSKCIERAQTQAHDRLVSMMLHTKFNIRGGRQNEKGDFKQDYPHVFTDREILLGSIDFAPLLNQSFIAYQNIEGADCQIILRIVQEDLSSAIGRYTLTFRPAL